jgi:hypothetical protein
VSGEKLGERRGARVSGEELENAKPNITFPHPVFLIPVHRLDKLLTVQYLRQICQKYYI